MHVDNLGFVLNEQELRCANHAGKDPNYIGIGDSTLIKKRGPKSISIKPGGTFKDYVAFYFGHLSPMLYEIKHGYNNVTKRPQEEIIYLVTTVEQIDSLNCEFVFFDGHGYSALSNCYNTLQNLNNVDWRMVYKKYWRDLEDDMDRKRRKQAEFLVHQTVPWQVVKGIGVYNDAAKQKTEDILASKNITCKVKVKDKYYF